VGNGHGDGRREEEQLRHMKGFPSTGETPSKDQFFTSCAHSLALSFKVSVSTLSFPYFLDAEFDYAYSVMTLTLRQPFGYRVLTLCHLVLYFSISTIRSAHLYIVPARSVDLRLRTDWDMLGVAGSELA
jgi:hypothetical protein